ncbi:recombinase family protein [Kitasatospora sp. NPDC002040]|uniref:recombinase family protein n=1 Tax=Kitasatospora sp. NPDC002040 TaxID=3154661 RepID=UPI00332710E7
MRTRKTAPKGAENAPVTPYDGCGMCLVGVRRLSRVKGTTSSPTKQRDANLKAAADVGGHIIAWADDWEVSGATDPRTRPGLGPWLCDQKGPYDGLVASAVDRLGRNLVDVLNTGYAIRDTGRKLVTADHIGVWDLDDPNQETDFTIKALGAQMEHRQTRTRLRDESKRARSAGQVAHRPSYGYMHVRLSPVGKVSHTDLDTTTGSAEEIREVARRILADQTGSVTEHTEAARLTRARVLSPADRIAVLYGRESEGRPWDGRSLARILVSKAALGYLMHKGEPLLKDGRPVRIAPPLWDWATHRALVKRFTSKERAKPHGNTGKKVKQAPKGTRLLTGRIGCGVCAQEVQRHGTATLGGVKYPGVACTASWRGVIGSEHCKPAPTYSAPKLETEVTVWFLAQYGAGKLMETVYDPGTGYADQIAELSMVKTRLRDDRSAGLYESEDDAAWFRAEYARVNSEIAELQAKPERPAGWHKVFTGKTVADKWHEAADDAERRGMLEEYGVRVTLYPFKGPNRRSREDRVVITAEVKHDPVSELVGATEGDPSRPDSTTPDAPATGGTSVRLAEPVAAPVPTPAGTDAPKLHRGRARAPEPALAA